MTDSRRLGPLQHDQAGQLAAVVLDLDPADLSRFLDRLAGAPQVAEAGWRVVERHQCGERHAARNAEIRRRNRQGLSYAQLAPDYGMTPSGIAKIVQRGRRRKTLDTISVSTLTPRYDCSRRP
jgi:hypothetical protein